MAHGDGWRVPPRPASFLAVNAADAAWVDRCLADIEGQAWTVVVVHDRPRGGMPYLPALLDRIEAMGAEFVQDFPDACVPIRRGVVEADLSPIVQRAPAPIA